MLFSDTSQGSGERPFTSAKQHRKPKPAREHIPETEGWWHFVMRESYFVKKNVKQSWFVLFVLALTEDITPSSTNYVEGNGRYQNDSQLISSWWYKNGQHKTTTVIRRQIKQLFHESKEHRLREEIGDTQNSFSVLVGWLVDRRTDGLIDWLTDWLTDCNTKLFVRNNA